MGDVPAIHDPPVMADNLQNLKVPAEAPQSQLQQLDSPNNDAYGQVLRIHRRMAHQAYAYVQQSVSHLHRVAKKVLSCGCPKAAAISVIRGQAIQKYWPATEQADPGRPKRGTPGI